MRRPPPYSDFPKFPVTGGTILLAIGVTAASMGQFIDIAPLVENGEIRRGELWRLLTSTLPHADLLHLVFNLYWTWTFGTLIELTLGHFKTILIFILLAIVANGAEYAFLRGGIGLSGVGYGLFGMLWVLSKRDRRFFDAVDPATIQLFVGWFFFCIVLTLAGYPIGNIAHGVGCAMGALLGWTMVFARKERLIGIAATIAITAGILAGTTIARPWINLEKFGRGETARHAGDDEARFGYAALMSNRNQSAMKWYRDAVRTSPTDDSSWYNLGIAWERLSNHNEAIACYQRAADLVPGDTEYRRALADAK